MQDCNGNPKNYCQFILLKQTKERDNMEQKITDTANKYEELARMLENFELEQPIDGEAPEEVQTALLKLYYAKALEEEVEKCEGLLEEDSDEETVNAVTEAAYTIGRASESAFDEVEEFCLMDKEFAERIDGITAGTETESVFIKLIKLYKCESIIKEARSCSMKFPLYGSPAYSNFRSEEDAVVTDAQQEITQKLGIDIYALFELRKSLIKEIGSIIERKANML
jgi:hypothetical protein